MVAAAQRGLFSEIFVWARPRGPNTPSDFTIQRLAEMVDTLPHVATYVKSLHITFDPTPEIGKGGWPGTAELAAVQPMTTPRRRVSLQVYIVSITGRRVHCPTRKPIHPCCNL